MKKFQGIVLISLFIMNLGCNQFPDYSGTRKIIASKKAEEVILCSPGTGKAVDKYGHPIPVGRTGLYIIANGFKVVPLTGLRSLSAFLPPLDSAMVSGDIIISRPNLAWVHTELDAHGFRIEDVHQYPARDGSVILFMHINSFGNSTALSEAVKALFSKLRQIDDNNRTQEKLGNTMTNLNKLALDSIIGHKAESDGSFYKYNFSRSDVLSAGGISVQAATKFNTWAAWRGTNEEAIVAGDFIMLEKEVVPVIKTLAENGIELPYNELVHEEPDLLRVHYWGVGNAEKLAKGLRAALVQQEKID